MILEQTRKAKWVLLVGDTQQTAGRRGGWGVGGKQDAGVNWKTG